MLKCSKIKYIYISFTKLFNILISSLLYICVDMIYGKQHRLNNNYLSSQISLIMFREVKSDIISIAINTFIIIIPKSMQRGLGSVQRRYLVYYSPCQGQM